METCPNRSASGGDYNMRSPRGANPAWGGRKMGPRLRGDDGRSSEAVAFFRTAPRSSFPRRRESIFHCVIKSAELIPSDQTGATRPFVLCAEHRDRRLGRV